MSSWTIYWVTRLDTLHKVSIAVMVLSFIILLVSMCGLDAKDADEAKFARYLVRRSGVALVALGLLLAFTPTTKEMCAIIAIPAIVNSTDAQEISSEVVDLARDWLKELKPKESK